MPTLGVYVALFLVMLLMLGAGLFAGILIARSEKETLENAGVDVKTTPTTRNKASVETVTMSNKQRVSMLTGIPLADLRSANNAPDDIVFWCGPTEWVVTERGIIQRVRGSV
jgi:hypothetical protein